MSKTLMFTPSGVCFNCLNGAHRICQQPNCTCSTRDHKQWWFRDDGIDNEEEALTADGHIRRREDRCRTDS